MFIDIFEFRKKMAAMAEQSELLSDDERDVLARAIEIYEEMWRIVSRFPAPSDGE